MARPKRGSAGPAKWCQAALLLLMGLAALAYLGFMVRWEPSIGTHPGPLPDRFGAEDVLLDVPSIKQRAKAAVMGGFVADAATMGLHWIYDVDQIQKLLGSHQEPAFFEPPSCPFYKYPSGSLSPYGDEILPLLTSIREAGLLDPEHFTQASYAYFSAYKGRLNHVPKQLVANIKQGAAWPKAAVPDDQAHGLVKVPLLVARYAGQEELPQRVEEAIRVHQEGDSTVHLGLAAAYILERVVVLGWSAQKSIDWAAQEGHLGTHAQALVAEARAKQDMDVTGAVKLFGQSCHLPGSFQAPLQCVLKADDYADGVRKNAVAGGDNCSRSIIIGALLAAQDGLETIPNAWKDKTTKYHELEALVDEILSQWQ